MQPSERVLALVVSLVRAGDVELLAGDGILEPLCPIKFRANVRAAAISLRGIYEEFSYTQSPEFLRSVSGKTESYRVLAAKLSSEPSKAAANKERLLVGLRELLHDDTAFQLVPENQHEQLSKARVAFAEVTGA